MWHLHSEMALHSLIKKQVDYYGAQSSLHGTKYAFRSGTLYTRVARGKISAMSPPKPCSAAQSQWRGNIWMGVEKGEEKEEGRKEVTLLLLLLLLLRVSYSPFLCPD